MDNSRTLLSWIASIAIFSAIGFFVWQASVLPKGNVEAVSLDVSTVAPSAPVADAPPTETLSQPEPASKPRAVKKASNKPAKSLPEKKSKAVSVAPTHDGDEQSPVEDAPEAQEESSSGESYAQPEETSTAPAPKEESETTDGSETQPAETQSESSASEQGESDSSPAAIPQFGTPGTTLNETQLSVMPGNKYPTYPWAARYKKQEGTVIIRAYIREDGLVDKVSIHQSSGSPILDKEAAETYFKWKYNPGKAGWVLKPFKFTFKE